MFAYLGCPMYKKTTYTADLIMSFTLPDPDAGDQMDATCLVLILIIVFVGCVVKWS